MKKTGKKIVHLFDKSVEKIVNLLGYILIFAGILLLLFHIFLYVHSGEWSSLPLISLTTIAPDRFVLWLVNPKSWLGLHKIISWILIFIPTFAFLIFFGLLFAYFEVDTE